MVLELQGGSMKGTLESRTDQFIMVSATHERKLETKRPEFFQVYSNPCRKVLMDGFRITNREVLNKTG